MTWSDAAQIAVASTLVLYGIGYVAAAPHYASAGVPIQSLSNHTVIAAGVLCAALTAVGVVAGEGVRRTVSADWRRANWKGRAVLLLLAVIELTGASFATLFIGNWRTALYVAMVGGVHWQLVRLGAGDVLRHGLTKADFSSLAQVLFVIGTFSTLPYPSLPVSLGGGQAEVLRRFPLTHGEPWLREGEDWFNALCSSRDMRAGLSSCRTVYRVYEDERHVYLAVEDARQVCALVPVEREPWEWAGADRDRYCVMRMPIEKLATLVFDGR
jgi:hypothetical protein